MIPTVERIFINLGMLHATVQLGFPTGVENMGGTVPPPTHIGGLKSIHWGAWGARSLKCSRKIPVKEFI